MQKLEFLYVNLHLFSSNLKLEHEFDRRVEEFHLQTNGNDHEDERVNAVPVSAASCFLNDTRIKQSSMTSDLSFSFEKVSTTMPGMSPPATDEMNEFDEKYVRMNDDENVFY